MRPETVDAYPHGKVVTVQKGTHPIRIWACLKGGNAEFVTINICGLEVTQTVYRACLGAVAELAKCVEVRYLIRDGVARAFPRPRGEVDPKLGVFVNGEHLFGITFDRGRISGSSTRFSDWCSAWPALARSIEEARATTGRFSVES